MSPRWLRTIGSTWLTTLLVAALTWLMLGLPLLPLRISKSSDTPFPCQHRTCGCATASQCWQQCCCFSDPEKLAWAREHQVRPPEWFLDRVLHRLANQTRPAVGSPRECCSTPHAAVGCAHASKVAATRDRDHATQSAPLITLADDQRCRGQSNFWATVVSVPLTERWQFTRSESFKLPTRQDSNLYSSLSTPPPVPPPEHSQAILCA